MTEQDLFDPFEHSQESEAVQPVLEFDGFNLLDAVEIKHRDGVVVIQTGKKGVVLSILPISGVLKARVGLENGSVRHYEKNQLRKVTI